MNSGILAPGLSFYLLAYPALTQREAELAYSHSTEDLLEEKRVVNTVESLAAMVQQ